MLHPDETPKKSYVETMLEGEPGPFIAASDYVRALSEQISQYVPGGLYCLGTDGMGRSETRQALRRHFEVDAQFITLAAIYQLQQRGEIDPSAVAAAIKDLGINPEKVNPYFM
jgi:pyruvate dehydrogenase E1 component